MRDTEERLILMHQRAAEIKRQEDMSRLKVLGSLSGGLLVCLVIVLQQLQNMHQLQQWHPAIQVQQMRKHLQE